MAYFFISIFIASFLLFQIQPLIGKYILPWFGSSPAVWSASLLFFQTVLAVGYAYAYWLTEKFSLRKQAQIHLVVLIISIGVMIISSIAWSAPILADFPFQYGRWDNPFWMVMGVLLVCVGIPFFLLATNSTLLQSWFGKVFPERSPYRLYALSNFASLLGLLSYPIFVEVNFKIVEQARWWSIFFGLFGLSVGVVAWRLLHSWKTKIEVGRTRSFDEPEGGDLKGRPVIWKLGLWFLLPAVSSILLLAATNQITQEIAVIPFLWVLPLALYLITFILSFESDRWYGRKRFTLILVLTVFTYSLLVLKGPLVAIEIQITTYSLLLFTCCMICHGELARLRPKMQNLPVYYLLIALGGAAGGIFVNLLAPFLFTQYWEWSVGLVLCSALFFGLTIFLPRDPNRWKKYLMAITQIVVIIWLLNIFIRDYQAIMRGTLWMDRNFFGILRVKERTYDPDDDLAFQLVHGITIHGLQFKDPAERGLTTTYYTETSGVGLAYENLLSKEPLRVGVLGLGVGTIAAYGKPGDLIRFYEINPSVVDLAQGAGGYFSYLEDSEAKIGITLGDARLSLANEYEEFGSQEYDMLVLDTFSSDAIPIHLLTYEAVDLYLRHLKRDGVLAIHISNIHLDLEPVVHQLANAHNLFSALVSSGRTRPGSTPSVWMLLTRNEEFLNLPNLQEYVTRNVKDDPEIRLWTDDYSNLFQIIR